MNVIDGQAGLVRYYSLIFYSLTINNILNIIILLILAGISIQALTNTGLFAKAEEAKKRTENAQKEESEILESYFTQIESINLKNVDKSKTDPESAMPKGATVIEGDANKGIVIKDSKDNEWTWVVVPKTIFTTATKADETDKIKADLITYASTYREGKAGQGLNWTDEWYSGCGIADSGTYTEMYNKMLSSIYTNGGFWISRYEVGIKGSDTDTTKARSSHTDITDSSIEAVSQANMIPYNYVYCSEAQALAKKMSTDTSKTSSLLFGIQWDLTCKFLEGKYGLDIASIKSDSKSWGNYNNTIVTPIKTGAKQLISGTWTLATTDKPNSSILLTTGASDYTKKMNIYDFAGNEWEWTLEKTSNTDYPCAGRGGDFNNYGSINPASTRNYSRTTYSDYYVGFRSALY